MAGKSDYTGVMLEEINSNLKTILEGQQSMATVPGNIAKIQDHIYVIENDIKAIKAVNKAHSKLVNNHEGRITVLEHA